MEHCATELDEINRENAGTYDHLVKKHPCFNGEAHAKYGRIHLPVSPACNIQCRFCKRGFNKSENRPGVSAGILKPSEALAVVTRALELCPQITVVGIAGPGDTLATDHATETFRLISGHYPDLICCLSTNGLRLAEKAKTLIEVGVKTITVTVNAADVKTLAKVCSHVNYGGQEHVGEAAAEKLLTAQRAGVKKAVELGLVVKMNTVLIPGMNDHQIGEIAKLGASLGVSFINVIPLIPQHELSHYPAPDCLSLNIARAAAEQYLPVFRHCRQCRADACGIPGSNQDWAEKLYGNRFQNTFSHG
ncbi:MAG TPA: radical SAM protein [Negativicutes bacterium]|nr:radical SAM protein [Negativicutes bacterium]